MARKNLARLKKGKYQRMQTRSDIIMNYGLKSRERISKSSRQFVIPIVKCVFVAIDEDISSMIKTFEADMKRLKGILVTYEEKVKDLSAHELE